MVCALAERQETVTTLQRQFQVWSWRADLSRPRQLPVRIDDELVRDAGVEVFVTFRRLLKIDHLDIYDLGDGQSVPEYRLHELPIVFEHRRLAGMERVRFCPTKAEAKTEVAMFGSLLLRARIVGHIQAGNAGRAGCT